jgi:hypothetical protein
MRATLTTLFLPVLASVSLWTPSPAVAGTAGTPAVYPGAVPGALPSGVALKTPPPQVKAYSTADPFATVKAWYQVHLRDKTEMQQPGMAKTEDAFLVGQAPNATVVMIRSFKGKTWILIGPPL